VSGTAVRHEEAALLQDRTRDHRRRIPALTGIRGYAALWVVLFHGVYFAHKLIPELVPELPVVARSGYLGVDLFFLLSGFVLTWTYGEALASQGWRARREFAIGRMFRILPLHWTVLALFAVTALMTDDVWLTEEPHGATNWLISAALIQVWVGLPRVWNTPAWSLSAEWFAYILFPIMAVAGHRVRGRAASAAIAAAAIVLVVVLFTAAQRPSLDESGRFGLARCVLEFAAGVAMCGYCRATCPSERSGTIMLLVGFILLGAAMLPGPAEYLALPAFSLMIVACVSPSRLAEWVFGNRIAHWLGEVSFSIYLLHWLGYELAAKAIRAADTAPLTGLALIAAVPILVVPPGWLAWRCVEIPGQAVGRAFVRRLRERDQAA
jgi:peptidoglycan/LPS O-acetylase OafA/YrhL